MVARVKLKGIDGKAPPGVESAALKIRSKKSFLKKKKRLVVNFVLQQHFQIAGSS